MLDLKSHRLDMRISQIALSRMAQVSRFRLWAFEQGTARLTPDEEQRIQAALRSEAARLAAISNNLKFEGAAGAWFDAPGRD
jgi:hypothetical protein